VAVLQPAKAGAVGTISDAGGVGVPLFLTSGPVGQRKWPWRRAVAPECRSSPTRTPGIGQGRAQLTLPWNG